LGKNEEARRVEDHTDVIYDPAVRGCSRNGCGAEAEATVALRYAVREVEILDLTEERDPNLLELCASHAAGLSPPLGWRVADLRAGLSAS
jgi:Protein of unknown function (DUF3499)